MRLPLAAPLLFLLIAACVGPAEELLPIPPAIKGASHVATVELVVRRSAEPAVAALDARAASLAAESPGSESRDYRALPLDRLMPLMIAEATREAGLVAGRSLTLVVEIDALLLRDSGAAFLGREDRLAGSVFIRDAATGAPLGQLYIDMARRNPGLIGLAARGDGVREKLVRGFADRIAAALTAPRAR